MGLPITDVLQSSRLFNEQEKYMLAGASHGEHSADVVSKIREYARLRQSVSSNMQNALIRLHFLAAIIGLIIFAISFGLNVFLYFYSF